MPVLAILVGLAAGFVVWGVLDQIQSRSVHKILQRELRTQLDQRSRENLIRFDHYVQNYASMATLLASHRRLGHYLEPLFWPPGDAARPIIYRATPPPWVPPAREQSTLTTPTHLLLVDREGGVREVYEVAGKPLPEEIRDRVGGQVLSDSDVRAVLTRLSDGPMLLVSSVIEDVQGYPMGYLVLVVAVNDEFLAASQRGMPLGNAVLTLVDSDDLRILVSSRSDEPFAGSPVDRWSGEYQITFQSLTQYEGTDWNVMFATLVPEGIVAGLAKRVGQFEERQRLISALAFISVFTLVIYLVSVRLNRVLKRMSRFSQRVLGIAQPGPERTGNQLLLLEEWLHQFGQLVLKTREEMRERHESEMRQSEALKTAILEASLDPIVTIDEQGSIIEFNPTAERAFGFHRDQVLGKRFAELFVAPGDRALLQTLLHASREQGGGVAGHYARGELGVLRSDQSRIPVEVSVVPLMHGPELVYTVYLHDVSERRKAEREIKSLARFASESPSPTLRVTRQGTLVYANAASLPLLAYWGCRRGQTLPLFWRGQVSRALDENRDLEQEVNCDGQFYSLLLAPVRELDYVNIYGRDITEVRRAEQEARQHQAELVHVCRLSTMGEVATGMAHELNQPLSAIANYANGCSRRLHSGMGGKKDLLAALRQITSQAERASEIIRRLRALVGKQPPTRSRVDLNHLVREVCSFVEYDCHKLGVPVDLELSSEPLIVSVDLVQIEQVLLNLVRNGLDAIEAIPPGDRCLRIRTVRDAQRVRVMVSDSGRGIEPGELTRLFDPFFTTKPSGMGMGLPISQTIVHDHAGRIWATSEPGAGADFHVELPSADAVGPIDETTE